MSVRLPDLVGFIGPGHKRHAFYRVVDPDWQTQLLPACGTNVGDRMINHTDPYGKYPVGCARCSKIVERVQCGSTPPHLAGLV